MENKEILKYWNGIVFFSILEKGVKQVIPNVANCNLFIKSWKKTKVRHKDRQRLGFELLL